MLSLAVAALGFLASAPLPPVPDGLPPDTAPAAFAATLTLPPLPRWTPGPPFASLRLAPLPLRPAPADTGRVHAVEYSDAYYTRLKVHRIGSYAILPLFAGQYYAGQRLMSAGEVPSWVGPTHSALAGGVGVVFGVNTVTGLWNLWDSRHDRVGRTRRWVHVATMLASDAGFLATGVVAGEAKHSLGGARLHRGLALGSIGLSTAGTLIMWLWKD